MKKLMLRKRLLTIVIAAGSVALVSVFYVTYRTIRNYINSSDWIQYTHEVLLASHQLAMDVKDIQVDGRAFLITKNNLFLNRIAEREKSAENNIEKLRALVSGNPSLVEKADSLRALFNGHTDDSVLIAASDEVVSQLFADSKSYEDAFQQAINRFQAKEYELLTIRKNADSGSILGLGWLLAGLVLALIMLVVLTFVSFGHTETLKVKLSEHNASLEKTLRQVSDYKYALDESAIVAITDQRGIISYVNDNFCKISKYMREELLGQDHRIINSGYHSKEYIRNVWQTIAKGQVWKGEFRNRAKDGTIYWVATSIVPLVNEQGRPQNFLSIRFDITDKKIVERRLQESEHLYRMIASGIPGSVISLIDKDYRYFLIEGDMIGKLGYSKSELLGGRASEVPPREGYEAIEPFLRRVFNGETFTVETHQSDYDLLSKYVPLRDEHNEIYAAMIVALDITELKDAERRIADLNTGLEEKIGERTAQLEAANKDLESFSYSVAHDLRAPVRAVDGYANMLSEDHQDRLDAEGKRLLDGIAYNANRMGQLIDDMLKFSRLGRKEVKKSKVDMAALIDEVLGEIPPQPVDIRLTNILPVSGDFPLLKQVLSNLLSNAIKYSSKKQQPVVQVSSIEKDGMIVYSIADNGVGFDMRYADKLFGVFQRLHSNEEFEGTGVGLAIVKRIINRHGGDVWADAKEGEGATFYFTLPIISHK